MWGSGAMRQFGRRFLMLAVFGAQSVAAGTALDASEFLQEPEYRTAVLSPEGSYLAQIWRDPRANTQILTVTDLRDGSGGVVGRLGDRVHRPMAVRWLSEERLLVDIMSPWDSGAAERKARKDSGYVFDDHMMVIRTLAMDVDAGNATPLIDRGTALINARLGSQIRHTLPADRDHVMLPHFRSRRLVLHKVNIYTGEESIVATGGPRTVDFLADEQGALRYRVDWYAKRQELRIFELDHEAEWRRVDSIYLLDDEVSEGGERPTLFGASGSDLVYRKRNNDTGRHELYIYRAEKESFETLYADPERDVLNTLFDGWSDQTEGFILDGDVFEYRYFDEEKQRIHDELANIFDPSQVRILSMTQDKSSATLRVEGLNNPGSFYLYNRESGKLAFLRDAYSKLSEDALGEGAFIRYKARDGLAISAYALFPPGYEAGQRYPLVVLPHGGPQSRDRALYDPLAQFIATRGYVVVKPNFRGSTGYGPEFEEAGYRQWGQAMQDDLSDAVDFLVRQGIADENRVCIGGVSYGGYAALMGVVKESGRYQCSFSINGVTDLLYLAKREARFAPDDYIRSMVSERIGDPDADAEMLRLYSPIHQVHRIETPLLIVTSEHDGIVPASHGRKMVAALERRDKVHRSIVLEKSGHSPLRRYDEGLLVLTEVEKFLARHLNN